MHRIKECKFECSEIKNKNGTGVENVCDSVGNVFSTNYYKTYFMPGDRFTKFLAIRDFDYDFERPELILNSFY